MHRRVKLKEIGFYLYPTKVAVFFFSFVTFWRAGFIEMVVVRGRGLGLLILKTKLNSEICRHSRRAYRVRYHSFKTFSRL